MNKEEAIKEIEKTIEQVSVYLPPDDEWIISLTLAIAALRAQEDTLPTEHPPCYLPEKENPYPLCVGRGFVNCAHCCLWADFDENQDESRVNPATDPEAVARDGWGAGVVL